MALLYRGPTVARPAPVRLQPVPPAYRAPTRRKHPQLRFALGQLAFLAAAVGVYFVVRSLTEGAVAEAERNAGWVVDVERWLHIFVERDLQSFALSFDGVLEVVNAIYIYGHWPVIAVVLVWLA
jgi:hypothetical protein